MYSDLKNTFSTDPFCMLSSKYLHHIDQSLHLSIEAARHLQMHDSCACWAINRQDKALYKQLHLTVGVCTAASLVGRKGSASPGERSPC